jgi:hypothetical protein
MRTITCAAFVALAGLGAARAEGQITTVVQQPKRVAANAQAVARRQEVAQDSVAKVTLTGMKQWVDSAAQSLALRPDTGTAPSETAVSANSQAAQRTDTSAATARPAQTPEFRDGAKAPDTATHLPMFALGGAALLVIGLVLRRRDPVRARVRIRR